MEIKPTLFFDMDGVVCNFVKGYKEMFQRDAYADDAFTVSQFCLTKPNFFRELEVLPKGKELYDALKTKYKIVFITTPMEGMFECKRDKLEWIKENFSGHDVIFSSSKADYVEGEQSILIDDMDYNLDPWESEGGTAINFNKSNDKIIKIISNVFDDQKHIEKVKQQLDEMQVDDTPTESQKESGNYKKGDVIIKGMKIKIENPKGSIRWGINFNGQKWIQRMTCHYGYITGYGDAEDGDKVDVFIGDKLNASRCFIVNQINPISGLFDEHKIILCVDNIKEAEELYKSNYKQNWKGLGSIIQLNTKILRDWLSQGKFTEPYK
jgi:5'(3')-deoxyribonucleotidase